ncbi:MAG: hypothetical protein M3N19_05395 [Candidatus Eremiobacteraeota bacterium]|nr:hypothetical protein [Candidatus Eremiobacteraeota bacterium]
MRRSSPKEELLFLALFIALFAATYIALQQLLLPHHFNKMVVLVLTSIIVALLTIFLRFLMFFKKREPR